MKVGVIGYGNMGRNHVRVLEELGHEVRVMDRDADKVPARLNYSSGEVLEWAAALVVATPIDEHKAWVELALEQEVPVLCEKPLAPTYDEAINLVGESRKLNAFLSVGYVERFNPVVVDLRSNLHALGHVRFVEMERVANVPRNRWRKDGILLELAVHDFDLLNFLFNQALSVMDSRSISEDGVVVFNRSDLLLGGLLASVKTSWMDAEKRRTIKVYAEHEVYLGNLVQQEVVRFDRDSGKVTVYGFPYQEPLKRELTWFLGRCGEQLSTDYPIYGLEAQKCADEIMHRRNFWS